MSYEQTATLVILGATLTLFVWGRFRYDLVAFSALIVAVLAGVVEPKAAFEGFGHPAVVTVAVALIAFYTGRLADERDRARLEAARAEQSMLILPADQLIKDTTAYHSVMRDAIASAG